MYFDLGDVTRISAHLILVRRFLALPQRTLGTRLNHWDHGATKGPMNPRWARIDQFLLLAIMDHAASSQRNASRKLCLSSSIFPSVKPISTHPVMVNCQSRFGKESGVKT